MVVERTIDSKREQKKDVPTVSAITNGRRGLYMGQIVGGAP
jgi:hypothetical protein